MNVERILRGVALGLGALFVLASLYVSVSRMTFPFDLEWMEGGELLHAREVLLGRGIYRAPSADFIAYSYQPLYPYLIALFAKVVGLSAGVGRAISIVSTLVAAWLVFRAVADRFAGALAVGMFFALYGVTGFWLDLVRVDALFFALLLGGLYVAKREKPYAWLVSALLLVLAFKAKQLALFFMPLPLPILWLRRRRDAIGFALVLAVVLGVDTALAQLTTHGWYSFFTQRVPTGQPYIWSRITVDFWVTIFTTLPVVMGGVVVALVARVREGVRALATDTWLLATAVGAFSTVLAWARRGGAANNFLTVYVFAIIVAASALPAALGKASPRARLGLVGAVIAQLVLLMYDPRAAIPSAREVAAGRALVATLAEAKGPVLIADHPSYAMLAGKDPSYQSNGLWEWQFTAGHDAFPPDLRERLASGYYALVVTAWEPSKAPPNWYPPELAERYAVSKHLEYVGSDFEAKSGLIGLRPGFLLVPR